MIAEVILYCPVISSVKVSVLKIVEHRVILVFTAIRQEQVNKLLRVYIFLD